MCQYLREEYQLLGRPLLGLESFGYVLLWPKDLGPQPFENGRGEEVIQINWREGSIYCPPSGWYHQHFNTGHGKARHLALRQGSKLYPLGLRLPAKRQEDGVYLTAKQGGTLIDYEEEDPEIRRRYELTLKRLGIASQMPPLST